jgi:hypothetical protein
MIGPGNGVRVFLAAGTTDSFAAIQRSFTPRDTGF